jgi:alpha-ketoglutarate-dependent taurine dioxygenase
MKENLSLKPLLPFGLLISSELANADLHQVATQDLNDWIDEHRVVVLRGFAPLIDTALPEFGRTMGELLEWEFGAVNELVVKADTRNYLYTNHAVPFHWDGAFLGRAPHYILFHCDDAPSPGSGGETLFCDSLRLFEYATPEVQQLWEQIEITYTTEKVVHYGGTFTSPLVTRHPVSHARVVRYAEPVADLNPVELVIKGIPEGTTEEFISGMNRRLIDERCCYSHEWLRGDVVVADNFALLHGRLAFNSNAPRNIRRVNIL